MIVSSTNANYRDWADLAPEAYEASKQDLVETTIELAREMLSAEGRSSSSTRAAPRPRTPPRAIISSVPGPMPLYFSRS